jgi:hypothetical protein
MEPSTRIMTSQKLQNAVVNNQRYMTLKLVEQNYYYLVYYTK